jgi:phosphatidylserine/phosphatidylglycerophosphate/cardiolipin synthase-like enzyme
MLAGILFAVGLASAQSLQLAESFPVETTLDHPGVPDAQGVWVEMIDRAETRIDLSQFYVSPKDQGDESTGRLQPVMAALEAAAERGVAIRFVIDARFARTYPDTLKRLERKKTVEVRRLDLKHFTGGVQHAKYFLVDGKAAWLGSQNFDWRSLEHITELGVRFDHPKLVSDLMAVFELDWVLAGGAADAATAGAVADVVETPTELDTTLKHGDGEVSVALVASPKALLPAGVAWDLPHLIAAIDGAKHRVRAQVMSYALVGYDKKYWDELDRAMRRAAARGVEVQFIVADWSLYKQKQDALKSLQVMRHLEVRVMSIPQFSEYFVNYGRVVHAKFLVVDGRLSWLGTSNWSRDYFHGSRNVGLMVEGEPFAAELDDWFSRMWESEYAQTIDPSVVYKAPRRSME